MDLTAPQTCSQRIGIGKLSRAMSVLNKKAHTVPMFTEHQQGGGRFLTDVKRKDKELGHHGPTGGGSFLNLQKEDTFLYTGPCIHQAPTLSPA